MDAPMSFSFVKQFRRFFSCHACTRLGSGNNILRRPTRSLLSYTLQQRPKYSVPGRCSSSLAQEFRRASDDQQKQQYRSVFRCPENNPTNHSMDHEGLFYTIPDEDVRRLFQRGLGTEFTQKVKTFRETCVMVRRPAAEVIQILNSANFNHPALKFVLYGENGTGKTLSLVHLIHFCSKAGWLILHVPWPAFWSMYSNDLVVSSHNPERRDLPAAALDWLAHFKTQNGRLLQELKITGTYTWSKREVTEEGAPLLEVVDHGLNRGKHASDCVGVVVKEAKKLATSKQCRLLLAVDGVNGFWRKSVVKDEDKKIVPTERLSLVHHFKKLIGDQWSNGAVITTVDSKAFQSSYREQCTPLYLLGDEGFKLFDPFVPIHIENYSDKEAYSCLEYFIDRHWIQSPEARTDAGLKQIIFKAGGNPYLLDRAVAPL